MKATKDTGIPEFGSPEEEREYWEAQGPLAGGRKGRINKPRPGQRRSSFLAVRLTGEELARLRDIAAQQGLGPSTFARLLLTSAISGARISPRVVTVEQFKGMLEQNLPRSVKEKVEGLTKATAIGDPDSPSLLIMDASQMKTAEELFRSLLRALLATVGVQVVTPEDENYEKRRSAVKTQT